MERRRLLLSAALCAALSFVFLFHSAQSAVAAGGGCSPSDLLAGDCPVINANLDDDGVTLGGTVITPGSPLPGRGGGVGGGTGADDAASSGATYSVPLWDSYGATGPATLSDLVNFHPAPGTDHMEPNGWAVTGLDTNFYAVAASQLQHGELLGFDAAVRFTPRRFHWSYGDGSSATLGTGGASWAALGIHEFDPTPTSHRYRKPGNYTIDLVIDFGAEYRFDDTDWIPIAGTIPVPANRLETTVGDAKTVLVGRDCGANPSGPGC